MKLPRYFGLPKKPPKFLIVRRVSGNSMLPALKPGRLVIASGWFKNLCSGDVVIVLHNDLEKIKRVKKVLGDYITVLGDNPSESTDSRHYGNIPRSSVIAKVIIPKC